MEPAAVLVGAFQIQRRRPLQVVAAFQHERMRAAGIKPDIENVGDLLEVIGVIAVAKKSRWVGSEPGVGAFCLESVDDAVHDALVAKRLAAFLVDEYRDRHPPGPLARYTPIGAGFDHAF